MTDSMQPAIQTNSDKPNLLVVTGDWTLHHAQNVDRLIVKTTLSVDSIDATGITHMDSSGAMLLWRLSRRLGIAIEQMRTRAEHKPLFDTVRVICDNPPRNAVRDFGFRRMLARLGYSLEDYGKEIASLIGFGGQSLICLFKTIPKPWRWRVTPTVHHMEQVGIDAVPLVILLSFMIGAVVAFLGATVLRDFGAEIFVIELVGISFLREFGVLLTAILLAGRTASAFTAQIGAMQSGEEIDAIRTLGLNPIELLVLPRLIALLVMLPLLTFLGMIAGIVGGLVVSMMSLGISWEMFLARLQETMEIRHFFVGMSKAPIFAVVIALIGCLEGFQTQGTAQSVGERTTSSVVQTISLVILIDAFAALWFMEMDL